MISIGAKKIKNKKTGRLNKNIGDGFFCSRVTLFFVLIFLASLVILFRLWALQVGAFDYYKKLADSQHSIFRDLIPERGEIFLKEGDGLYPGAINKESKTALAVPREIEGGEETVEKIAEMLGLEKKEVLEKLDDPEDTHEVLKKKISEEEVRAVREAKISGLRLIDEPYRMYPSGELASQVLGFVGWKDDSLGGRYGVESYFEKSLSGAPGKLFQNRDNRGFWITTGEKEIEYAKNGESLVLTIDHIIQYEAEKILRNAVDKFGADRGTIVVMETATGRLMALANFPTFDPNQYQRSQMENFRNLAVSDAYECGSVFKPFTMAAALDEGKIAPETTYVDNGKVVEKGYYVQNSDEKAYGLQTMTEVLEKSLNTGVVYAEKLIGNKNFSEYVKRFGFGETTGIELPGETKGNISNLDNLNRNINFFTASFGQGITVTPLQLVSAYNALANGGTLLKPQIVEKIISADGIEKEIKPQISRKVISEKSALEISRMLRQVVVKGHGKRADVPGYLVSGKTGTAQVASRREKGYEKGKNIGSFAGYAPMENPVFTMVVRIDNPKEVEWAESSAAPIFGELAKFILEYRNVKPTEEFSSKDLEIFSKTHILREHVIKEEKKDGDDRSKDKKIE